MLEQALTEVGVGKCREITVSQTPLCFLSEIFLLCWKEIQNKTAYSFHRPPPTHTHLMFEPSKDLVSLCCMRLKGKNKNEPKQSKNSNWYLVGSCSGPSLVQRAFQVSHPQPLDTFSPSYRCRALCISSWPRCSRPQAWAWFASVPLIP